MIVKSLCKTLVVSSMILGSCGEEKRPATGSPEPTPTPEPTELSSDANSKEIERLKARITELSSSPNSDDPDDNDGWLLVGEPQITKELLVRVDFDNDDFGKRMKLTLSECGNIKLLGNDEDVMTISNTVSGKVGNISEIGFYHPNGKATASSGACKLTANIIGQSKSKNINIKAGSIELSQAKNSNGTARPFFDRNSDDKVTVLVATKGISGDELSIFLWEERNEGEYRYAGKAYSGLRSDRTVRGAVCKGDFVGEENSEELVCVGRNRVANDWMRNKPTIGNYMLVIKAEDGVAILETGELENEND